MVGLEADNAVTRVAANFSKIANRSSDLICGADVEVVGINAEVEG